MDGKDEFVYLARLCEQSERYDGELSFFLFFLYLKLPC